MSWRGQFPFIKSNRVAAYLDSAASAQKPACVLAAIDEFYKKSYGNTHRGVHAATERATAAYEAARATVAKFIGAASVENVIFTHGTTESLNMAAWSFGEVFLKKGDTIVVTVAEHHSNFLPWARLAEQKGASLEVLPLMAAGEFDWVAYEKVLAKGNVKLVAVTHVSNVMGSVMPLEKIVVAAHAVGAKVIADGAQAVAHLPVDVQELGVDAYAFSGHKLYGPTGVGVLVLSPAVAESLPPYMLGGGMVHRVGVVGSTFAPVPYRFEAGTPPIAEAVGLAAAIKFVEGIGFEKIGAHEKELTEVLLRKLSAVEGMKIYGSPAERVGVVAFNVGEIHPHDVGTLLDQKGVAVRVGHHCAQPLMSALGIPACVRASVGLYNNLGDVEKLVAAVEYAKKKFV